MFLAIQYTTRQKCTIPNTKSLKSNKIWLFVCFQETANADRAWDLTVFADLINFANFIRNRLEFEDIISINFAADGQDVLVKNSLLKPVYQGQINKKSETLILPFPSRRDGKSCSPVELRYDAPRSISKLCALRCKAASSERNLSFEIHLHTSPV